MTLRDALRERLALVIEDVSDGFVSSGAAQEEADAMSACPNDGRIHTDDAGVCIWRDALAVI